MAGRGEVDNRQAAMAQTNILVNVHSLAVGPAMSKSIGHPAHINR